MVDQVSEPRQSIRRRSRRKPLSPLKFEKLSNCVGNSTRTASGPSGSMLASFLVLFSTPRLGIAFQAIQNRGREAGGEFKRLRWLRFDCNVSRNVSSIAGELPPDREVSKIRTGPKTWTHWFNHTAFASQHAPSHNAKAMAFLQNFRFRFGSRFFFLCCCCSQLRLRNFSESGNEKFCQRGCLLNKECWP